MTGIQIYNTCWLAVWLLLAIGGLFGIVAGNWAHWITLCGSLCFCYLFFTDHEDGESLKDLIIRKLKAHKTGKEVR